MACLQFLDFQLVYFVKLFCIVKIFIVVYQSRLWCEVVPLRVRHADCGFVREFTRSKIHFDPTVPLLAFNFVPHMSSALTNKAEQKGKEDNRRVIQLQSLQPLASPRTYRKYQALPYSQWVPDSAQDKCMVCRTYFSYFFRRHHCRFCGYVLCYQCSSRLYDSLRCCEACFTRQTAPVFEEKEKERLMAELQETKSQLAQLQAAKSQTKQPLTTEAILNLSLTPAAASPAPAKEELTPPTSWKERLTELEKELKELRKQNKQLDSTNKEQKMQLEVLTRAVIDRSKAKRLKGRKISPKRREPIDGAARRSSVGHGAETLVSPEISRPTSAQSMRSWLERPVSLDQSSHSPHRPPFSGGGRAGLGRPGGGMASGAGGAGLIGMGPISVEFDSPTKRDRVNSDSHSVTSERSVRSNAAAPKASGKEVQGAFEFMQDLDA
eukprot:g48371.t1